MTGKESFGCIVDEKNRNILRLICFLTWAMMKSKIGNSIAHLSKTDISYVPKEVRTNIRLTCVMLIII